MFFQIDSMEGVQIGGHQVIGPDKSITRSGCAPSLEKVAAKALERHHALLDLFGTCRTDEQRDCWRAAAERSGKLLSQAQSKDGGDLARLAAEAIADLLSATKARIRELEPPDTRAGRRVSSREVPLTYTRVAPGTVLDKVDMVSFSEHGVFVVTPDFSRVRKKTPKPSPDPKQA
ncbi:hypothetical protein [Mitsuaria sp. GD03876]|uniref:hypothetical protein n=1 Tax=Mitsuaria sp. GD03876 TaxID=2975399 RepID=UPI00244CD999|nr:hypothetical protein [Mitsuaria sp. GD03876]MDH0867470.1 hypothetical protein [Mitsuaria sp. GD03876]